ncbi:uncharacterized protein LOC660166 [Tribolium castaneum]|uniref:Uncharacterized protein n=1 Tax=Tribolium castaneum TaxID=7070 RepID=D6WIE9_TRICA|nr:PREDICTED: uncharacterized protein LOC660166 [Tribolium castaneum]EEZ99679.1 hypothetical protein TcasGA2_TC002436 [Tribolium castaneum]|eukprot:XP_971514.1 PREDICTED: uncharacterized protein LOC660166 [Tribolium castaneum]
MLLFAFILFAFLQTSFPLPATENPAPTHNPAVEFFKEIPLKPFKDLNEKHLKEDTGFQAALVYLKSPEWIQMVADVRKDPAWLEYKKFLNDSAIDIEFVIKHVEHCLNATNTKDFKVDKVKPSLGKFFDDVKTTYSVLVLKAAQNYLAKESNSATYRNFIAKLQSQESRKMLEKALGQPPVKKVALKLKEMDFDIEFLLEFYYSLLGWRPIYKFSA